MRWKGLFLWMMILLMFSANACIAEKTAESIYEHITVTSESGYKLDQLTRYRKTGEYEDFDYALKEDGTCTIVKYNGFDENVNIPLTIEGISVTQIEAAAFEKNTSIRKVILPASLKIIREYAFYQCARLQEVDMPEDLEEIEDHAFYGCRSLEQIRIPQCVHNLGAGVFRNCIALTEIIVDANNTSYGMYNHFLFDKEQKKVISYAEGTLPTKLSIPEGTLVIGMDAFGECITVREIEIPNTLQEVEMSAFYDRISGKYSFPALERITIQEGSWKIGKRWFADLSMEEITLPETLQVIDDGAFNECTRLEKINIPKSVEIIGDNPFRGCIKLKTIDLPEDHPVFSLDKEVLLSQRTKKIICMLPGKKMKNYHVPEDIVEIGDYLNFK